MKLIIVIAIFIGSIFLVQCVSQKNIAYEFPTAMAASVKSEFIKQCDKGRILYDINCSGCHSTRVKGKEVIPDFAPEQLKGYELRVTNSQHESKLTDMSVTAEELGLIMTFLNYKKKNQSSTVGGR